MSQDFQRRSATGVQAEAGPNLSPKLWTTGSVIGTQVRAAAGMLARVVATATIWIMATGMLALCIPLVKATAISTLPLFVIGGATASTALVWLRGYRIERNAAVELTATRQRLREIEERLDNLETINTFEHRLAKEAAARQASGPPVVERESEGV